MMFRFAKSISLCVVACLALVACTPRDKVHRDKLPSDEACQKGDIALGKLNRESGKEARCFIQTHTVPAKGAWSAEIAQQNTKRPAQRPRQISQPDSYDLSFIELGEVNNQLALPAQLALLQKKLRSPRQKYVMAFVHGWRHDAKIRNSDVRKFRTILGFARSALNSRCLDHGTYCDVDLTGVFIGWRGRAFREPVGAKAIYAPFAGPTFFRRKQISALHGTPNPKREVQSPLEQVLRGIEATLNLDQGNDAADKFLIFGHSLGGNMLASLMQTHTMDALKKHSSGQKMKPVFGDMVILINPAAEASKWTSLQKQSRTNAGLTDDDDEIYYPKDAPADFPNRDKLKKWKTEFPIDQTPFYVSLTSTFNWAAREGQDGWSKFDTTTAFVFPISQILTHLFEPDAFRPSRRSAIGHREPYYEKKNKPNSNLKLRGNAVGSSHEFVVYEGNNKRSTYAAAGDPATSYCKANDGWLLEARQAQVDENPFGDFWKWGKDGARNAGGEYNPTSFEWRHGLNLRSLPDTGQSVASPNSPLWNVRAFDKAIVKHAGYRNYPLWCALHQLVLDNPTAKK